MINKDRFRQILTAVGLATTMTAAGFAEDMRQPKSVIADDQEDNRISLTSPGSSTGKEYQAPSATSTPAENERVAVQTVLEDALLGIEIPPDSEFAEPKYQQPSGFTIAEANSSLAKVSVSWSSESGNKFEGLAYAQTFERNSDAYSFWLAATKRLASMGQVESSDTFSSTQSATSKVAVKFEGGYNAEAITIRIEGRTVIWVITEVHGSSQPYTSNDKHISSILVRLGLTAPELIETQAAKN